MRAYVSPRPSVLPPSFLASSTCRQNKALGTHVGCKIGLVQVPISSPQLPVHSPYLPASLYRLWRVSLVVAVNEEHKV